MKEFKSLKVIGKRWFQKSYGNTYHSVSIIVDDVEVSYIPFRYGYESSYEQTAAKWLQDNGYIPASFSGTLWSYFDEINIPFFSIAYDVSRKKDL